MLWPALRALSRGNLTEDQLRSLIHEFQLDPTPRTEGPGAAGSLAHRVFSGGTDTRLVLDLARVGKDRDGTSESAWAFALFFEGERPDTNTVEAHRTLIRSAIERFGLTLIEIEPPAAADEVFVMPETSGRPESFPGAHWPWPYADLDRTWPHLGVRPDAPREVKEVKLREVMRTPAWPTAPDALRREAEAFLRGE